MHSRYPTLLNLLALTLVVLLSQPIAHGAGAQRGILYRPCEVAVAASNFSGHWALYLLRPYDYQVYELSGPSEADRSPVWSPDGRQIAFERREGNNWDIYTRDLSTGMTRRLTNHQAFDGHPSWSPDGKLIAFESSRDGTLGIYTVPATGGPARVAFQSDVASTAPVWQSERGALLVSSWSKGRRVLFATEAGSDELAEVDLRDDLGQAVASDEGFASAALIGSEAHILAQAGQRPPQDLSRPGDHHEWPAWDRVNRRWAALELVGGNHYEYPQGWHIVIFGQPNVALPLLLPGQWQRLGCAPNPAVLRGITFSLRAVPARDLQARGTTPPPASGSESLMRIAGLEARQPQFVQSVASSFMSLRAAVRDESGHDALGALNDAWRDLASDSGATFSWHKAGRAFDMRFNLSDEVGQPLLFISKEVLRHETYFRLYVRASSQDGSQGEPLRQSLWVIDFAQLDERGLPTGGRTYAPNEGYFVDLTDLAQRHGWLRISAATRPDFDWHRDFYALEFWHYERKDGLCWYDALKRLYPPERVAEWIDYDRLIAIGRTPEELSYFCIPEMSRHERTDVSRP